MTNEPGFITPDLASLGSLYGKVVEERRRQDRKWGEQNHPDGTGPGTQFEDIPTGYDSNPRAEQLAQWARARCQDAPNNGGDTWEKILTEEIFEAYAESDPERLEEELIQCVAVILAWLQAIHRRKNVDRQT